MSNEIETLDLLPGEGDTEVVTRVRTRRGCDNCGDPAHFKHTFLLPNARSNPASKAYRHDDCSWCEDAAAFTCKKCSRQDVEPDGYGWCSTFPASDRFKHMFLYWEETKP